MVGRPLALADLAMSTRSPLFRAYLGEWRRLADQASNLAVLPLTAAQPGAASALRQRCRIAPSAATRHIGREAFNDLSPTGAGRRETYGFYLANPWIF